MAQVLDYSVPGVADSAEWRAGALRLAFAVLSSACILYFSYDARAFIARCSGDSCGTPSVAAEGRLVTTGLLLLLPLGALLGARDGSLERKVCRTSLLTALVGWLVCLVPPVFGLP